jgi:two-component system chemotaxis response regulator CheY
MYNPGAAMKLMIVDDSGIIRNRITRLAGTLSSLRIDVVGQAKNGREAIDLFATSQPDIVTMDLTMPEMDGVECTRRLVDMCPDVRILVVSALSDKPTALKALKNGASDFLYKPFNDRQLIDAIEELVS